MSDLVILLPLAGLFMASIGIEHAIQNRLRTAHEHHWKELGSPTLIMNNSISNGRALSKFLRGEHLSLGDESLNQLVQVRKYVGWGYFAALGGGGLWIFSQLPS